MGGGRYILDGDAWWWVVVSIFWEVVGFWGWWWVYFEKWWVVMGLFRVVVGSGRFILGDGRWWWIILECGEWW